MAYANIFGYLRNTYPEFKPYTIYCDHSTTQTIAAQEIFGDIENFHIINTFFHYSQVILIFY